jgi:5'-3' exonuclease
MIDLVVDGNSLFARSWFAAKEDPEQALQYALTTILLLLNPNYNRIGVNFDRTLFAWDAKRNEKKDRDPKPASYVETCGLLKDIFMYTLTTANVEKEGFEADDIVATAVYATKPKDTVYVVSADKDLMQLQGGNCHFYCLHTKGVLSQAFINAKFHVKHPSQIPIALAVIGDGVDNIPGIRGWGPKKAQKLFEAVKPKMDFEQALDAIEGQIPPDKQDEFYESLERTLLNMFVPGVPAPLPILMPTPDEFREVDMPKVDYRYTETYQAYMVEPY